MAFKELNATHILPHYDSEAWNTPGLDSPGGVYPASSKYNEPYWISIELPGEMIVKEVLFAKSG